MPWSSTSRTSSPHRHPSSSTLFMTPTEKGPTLCEGIPSASGKEPPQLSPTASGSTSLITMLPLSWLSPRRGTRGTQARKFRNVVVWNLHSEAHHEIVRRCLWYCGVKTCQHPSGFEQLLWISSLINVSFCHLI